MAIITHMGSIKLLLFGHRGSNSTKAMKFDEVITIPMDIISLCSFYLQSIKSNFLFWCFSVSLLHFAPLSTTIWALSKNVNSKTTQNIVIMSLNEFV